MKVEGVEIKSLSFNSSNVSEGCMFFAIKGTTRDGHDFIDEAVEKGAAAIVCNFVPQKYLAEPNEAHAASDPAAPTAQPAAPTAQPAASDGSASATPAHPKFIVVDDTSVALAKYACDFYGNPSRELNLVGVTGTNGKTTTATLLYRMFRGLGHNVGLISTIENRINDKVLQTKHTTPDPIAINSLLKQMLDSGCKYVFMEVSSHAVVQHRIDFLEFKGGIFSNITRDHLDYHKTFKAYIDAKKGFFDSLPKDAFALTNIDDSNGKIMVQNTKAKVYTYSLNTMADFKAKIIENSLYGLELNINSRDVNSFLLGKFNAYNLCAIYATAVLLGVEEEEALKALSLLKPAEGRFEIVKGEKQMAIVDYAHTPDALENVLSTIVEMKPLDSEVYCIVGCGGDRDAGKRPMMAEIACKYSNTVILTSDNPRSENPSDIIDQMYAGVPKDKEENTIRIENREEAIKMACKMAQPKDFILVAGKGHETYQEIKGQRLHFDDREILRKYIK